MGTYVYRRELTRDEMLPALGIGLGVGLGVALVTAYVARIFLSRTPLEGLRHSRESGNPAAPPAFRHSRASGNPGHGAEDLDSRLRGNDGREGHGGRLGHGRDDMRDAQDVGGRP